MQKPIHVLLAHRQIVLPTAPQEKEINIANEGKERGREGSITGREIGYRDRTINDDNAGGNHCYCSCSFAFGVHIPKSVRISAVQFGNRKSNDSTQRDRQRRAEREKSRERGLPSHVWRTSRPRVSSFRMHWM